VPVVPVGSLLERVEENEEEPVNPGSQYMESDKDGGGTGGAVRRAYSKEFFGVHNFKRSCMM